MGVEPPLSRIAETGSVRESSRPAGPRRGETPDPAVGPANRHVGVPGAASGRSPRKMRAESGTVLRAQGFFPAQVVHHVCEVSIRAQQDDVVGRAHDA